MPTINKRFLLKLVLVMCALAGALVGAHAVQARRIPAALKAQSERAAENGKNELAIHYLRQYLEFHPDDADAQVQLAQLVAKRGRGATELLFLYDKILRLDPTRHAIRRDALALCIRAGRYSDALVHAEALVKEFPKEPALWQQFGAAQAGANDLKGAKRSYETAIAHAPDELLGYQRLAQLVWRGMNDAAGARDALDRMTRALPREAEAYLLRAKFELFAAEEAAPGAPPADLRRAKADLLRALELDPENAEASLMLADVMQKARNIPAAHALLRDAASTYPKNLKIVRALSWLELLRGNSAAAVAVLEDGLKADPNGTDLLVPLADLLVQQGDTARTAEIVTRLRARKAPASQVKYLEARLAMRDQKWAQAAALFDALRNETRALPGLEAQANLLLAACYQKLGDPVNEERAYLRVITADARNVTARVGLGNLYLNLGRFDDAAREFEAATLSPYATGAVIAQWARLKARLVRRSEAPLDWQKLDLAVTQFAPRFGRGASDVVLLRAELLAAQNRPDEAAQLLRRETATRASDPKVWAALALFVSETGGSAAGLAVLDEGQAASGDSADLRLARAALYAREPGRVRPIERTADHIAGWSDADQVKFLTGLVEVYDSVGDRAGVLHVLRRVVARYPNNAAMWLKLHERAGPGPDADAARAALAKLEGPTGPSVVLCDARLAPAQAAAQLIPQLVTAFGESPTRADACLALARLCDATGDRTRGARLTDRAYTLDPTGYAATEAVIARCATDGAQDRANELLERLALDPRWAGEPFRRVVRNVLATVPDAVGDKLFAAARPLVAREPGGAAWVAETAAARRTPEAPALFDGLTAAPRATPDDWLRKALLVSKDNPAAGAVVVAQSKAALPALAFARLSAVYADSAAGSTFAPTAASPAEAHLLAEARLAVKLSRGKPAEAVKVLEGYLADATTKGASAEWARRNLAMLYAAGGTQADRDRAMELLKGTELRPDAPVEDLRATAAVLATLARFLEGRDRRAVLSKSVAALEAVHTKTNAPSDLFTVAQLYRAAGDRAAGRKALQQLLNRKPEELAADPQYALYLTTALEELVEDGNFQSAAAFAGKLAQMRAYDFRSLAAIARYEAKAGRPERALAVAEDYARLADANGGDYLARSAQVAELLDELSRLPNVRGTQAGRAISTAAAERFAALVPNRPDAVVGLAGVLAADGRAADAIARTERVPKLTARLKATAAVTIARGTDLTAPEATQLLKWIDDGLAEEPNAPDLLMHRGEFLARRGDLRTASAAFEQVLAKDDRNVVALNNLAWLMSANPATAEKALELVARATRESGMTGELLDTRARVQITLKQFDKAERDLADAISYDPTPLRWFHVALLRLGQEKPTEAAKAFTEAQRRGLESRTVHPADAPTFAKLGAK
jgi:tetratricopeptide (TPR) repeat protein